MKTRLTLAAALATAVFGAAAAQAEVHEVKMLNRGPDGEMMVFEPDYLEIDPGDTVVFLPTDRSHNAESILNMLPDGGETFKGRMNQEVRFTPTAEGVYGVKCLPHYGLGMIALIKVGEGEAANLGEAAGVRHPGRAAGRFDALFQQMDE